MIKFLCEPAFFVRWHARLKKTVVFKQTFQWHRKNGEMNSKMQRKGISDWYFFLGGAGVDFKPPFSPYYLSVLAIQAKKKRYKAPKARMRPEDTKSKPKRWANLYYIQGGVASLLLQRPKFKGFLFSVMSSGSVSSFNDDDYEVDENSDDEEQEDSGDYCKGKLAFLSE